MSDISWKKFKSPNSDVRRVALLSGHIYELGLEWVLLPDFAWSEAYRAGCMSEDMVVGKNIPSALLASLSDEATEIETVKGVIKEALDKNIIEAFKKDGSPNAFWIHNKLGHRINKEVIAKAWFKIENGE